MSAFVALFALLAPLQVPQYDDARPDPPNIVLILADDFGVDLVGAYGEGSAPPCTPNIDSLAARGMLFRNAWAYPVCSSTRATVLTGRYGLRTGIGGVITSMEPGLPLSEFVLPEMLSGYQSTYTGKWHLSGNAGLLHPNDSGFDHFAGSLRGQLPSYFQWPKVIDGQQNPSMTYATTDTVDEAVAAIRSMSGPWLLYVAFNAPHLPFHEPPNALCPPSCVNGWCDNLPPNPSNLQLAKAMVEAMDTEIGRLLATLDAVDPNAWVFFMGDNGTAITVSEPPFPQSHSKGTLYEGGVNVPLIVRGPGVVQTECSALVSSADLFATFAELALIGSTAEDSVSMVPYFQDPTLSLRDSVYAELFFPNGTTPPLANHGRTIREERYKLIRISGQEDEFYDLWVDPFESTNLLPGLTPEEQQAFDFLEAELVALGVG